MELVSIQFNNQSMLWPKAVDFFTKQPVVDKRKGKRVKPANVQEQVFQV